VNVGIVKLSALGDVVHALPVAVTLRAQRPDARITWIVEARESAVLRGHHAIDAVVCVDTRRWRRTRGRAALMALGAELRGVRRQLRAAGLDVVLDAQGLMKSGVIARATGAPVRVGFARRQCREPLSALFTNRHVTPSASATHVVDQYLALLAPLRIDAPSHHFDLPRDAVADSQADELLAGSGLKPLDRLVIVNPGAGRADKRWPPERYAELARRLREDAAASVVVVWGPGERAIAETIAQGGAILAPPTDVAGLTALLRRASVVVASDTGPLHLAAAVGTLCVGLYGPTRAERNGPYGCGHGTIQSPVGSMTAITVPSVLAAVQARLP
jgi:lipopolysaccharide heptosyltransferase I